MALIRLQNKVPSVYTEASRDFQLLCRVFDVIINGTKYDIDGIARIVNSHDCKSNVLKLLQTKLGFFSYKEFTDQTLRYILEAFPILVKKKGSILAIKEAIYTYLKINGLEVGIKIDIVEDNPTLAQKRAYGTRITDHSVVIGIESDARDIIPLREVLKYIIPFGYNLYFYFYNGQVTEDLYDNDILSELILVSDDVNALAASEPIVKNEDGSYKYWNEEDKWYDDVVVPKTIRTSEIVKREISSVNTVGAEYDDYGFPSYDPAHPTEKSEKATKIIDVRSVREFGEKEKK